MKETGYGIPNPLWFVGVIENNMDARLEGRVQVRAFGIHGTVQEVPTESLPWATLINGTHGPNFNVPPLNAWVFGFFIDGRDAQQPMILGLIPTQMNGPIDPAANGWGALPGYDYDRLGQGNRPEDFGQPMMSRLARGENIEQTYNLPLEVTRVRNIETAGTDETWEEPGSAFNPQYPHNKVIETASGHSIELDDTPGSERIMVYHRSGSYVQIDSRGTTTHKSTSDKYDMNEANQHVYVGGKNVVTIEGDSHVLVRGNKTEEIYGDYRQIVHGSHELSVAGQLNLNGSEETQIRSAKVSIESNIENVSIKGGKEIRLSAGKGMHVYSAGSIFMQSEESLHALMGEGAYISAADGLHAISEGDIILNAGGALSVASAAQMVINADGNLSLKSAATTSLDGSAIHFDNNMGGGPLEASAPEAPEKATGVKLAEPAFKSPNLSTSSMSGGYASSYSGGPSGNSNGSETGNFDNSSSMGTVGFNSVDDYDSIESFESNCDTDLVEYVKSKEGFSARAYWDADHYSVGYGLKTNNPNETITKDEADRRLRARLSEDRAKVKSYGTSKGYKWNDCQIDAITSFVYNLGFGAIYELTANGSRSDQEIASKIPLYNKSNGKVLAGLTTRRNFEASWFKSGLEASSPVKVANNNDNEGNVT